MRFSHRIDNERAWECKRMETLLFNTLLALGVALCPLGIIVLMIWFVLSVALPINQRLQALRLLKTTPCDRCYYFNPDPELQCAVQPDLVLTRLANQCRDFNAHRKPFLSVIERGPKR